MKTILALLALALLASACTSADSTDQEIACSVTGSVRFDPSLLDAPEFTKEQFLETDDGQLLDAFFVGGIGEPEGEMYAAATGFSPIGGGTILGYTDGVPTAHFDIEDGDIRSWGGCRPQWVWGDRVAARFRVPAGLDGNRALLPILIEGGGCVVEGEVEITTVVAIVEVEESGGTIEIRPWTRERNFRSECAGVGVDIEHEIVLTAPLGQRLILDAGLIPAQPADRDG